MIRPDEYTMWLERARTGRNVQELEKSYALLLERVKKIDPITIAETTDGEYQGDSGAPRVLIPFLHSWFVLYLLPYGLKAAHPGLDTLPMKALVLQHLITAAENQGTAVRVMGRWIDCRSLHCGAVLGAHFSRAISDVLSIFFSFVKEQRLARALKLGGRPVELADEAFVFKFFPRLPVALIHWKSDEEFPPFSKILYDVSASNYMATHGLAALTAFLVHRLAE